MSGKVWLIVLLIYLAPPVVLLLSGLTQSEAQVELLNVSYDPTRELYRKLNHAFIEEYQRQTGTSVRVRQSHGGSGSQARAVIDGLRADVVSLAMWSDTDAIRKKGLIADGWEARLPNRSLPYYSTIVFVVRKGNPKRIHDWPDLLKPGVQVITPNPKTSGGARLNLLAAWGDVLKRGGTEADARDFVTRMYRQCPVLDSGARGSTVTFARRMIGDVHLTWENEARLEAEELPNDLEVVYPPRSIRAEPHVALVGANVEANERERPGTRAAAEAYVTFLYSETGQEIIAQNHYRPTHAAVAEKYKDHFPVLELLAINDVVRGGWDAAQKKFFADGGVFDQIYQPGGP
jgi:sulfate/thiosulfate transport system substrate-binding protein